MTKLEKRQIINTAKELGYSQATLDKLEKAIDSIQAQNILVDARKSEVRVWNR